MATADSKEEVVLVDWDDHVIGKTSKLEAHEKGGRLHRAISVLIFDSKGRMLLQRRALSKYHAPGLWTNACCSHPRPGEATDVAAHRRLQEEMGIDCPLRETFTFTYEVPVGNGLTEREFDHVFVGTFDGPAQPDPAEVAETRWVTLSELYDTVRLDSPGYTPWFKIILIHMAHAADAEGPRASP